jgi:hypothetical protein
MEVDSTGFFTVIVQLAVLLPSAVVAVMVAVPSLTAVTFAKPQKLDTCTTSELEDVHWIFWNGDPDTCKNSESPTFKLAVVLFKVKFDFL